LELELQDFLALEPDARWAVRSSGVQEDLADASFAGLYTTVLNVQGPAEVAAAIRTCWASLFSERVQSYLQRKGLDPTNLQLGVVIQKMVPAQKSGVLFTVHPLSGHDTQMLIEAVPGLGEALVSGNLTPDSFVWDWRSRELVSQQLHTQERRMVTSPDAPFVVWEDLAPEAGAEPVLEPAELARLAELALRVQQGCGFPVDIEWVWDAGAFYLVQSRPITKIHTRGIAGEWTTADFKDGGVSSDVCTPFMWSLYDFIWEITMPAYLRKTHLLAAAAETARWGDMFFARPYWNVGAVKLGLQGLPGYNEREFDTDLGIEVAYEGSGHVTPTNARTLIHGLKVLAALKKSFAARTAYNPGFAARQLRRLTELEQSDPAALTDAALFAAYADLIRQDYFLSESSYFYHIFDNSNVTTLFKDSFRPYKDKANYLALISGLEDLSHLRQNFELWELSRRFRAQPETLAYWQSEDQSERLMADWRDGATALGMDAMRAYIIRFGYHSTRELDLTVPRFAEDPGFVFASLRQLLEMDDSQDPRELNRRQHRDYLQARAKLLAAVPFYKRRAMTRSLDQLRAFLWWREELRDLSTRMYHQVRRWTLELAERLTGAGTLAAPADVFFLPVDDLLALIAGELAPAAARAKVADHRVYYESFRHYRNPDEIGSRYSGESRVQSGPVLSGVACSPGRVSARARVIQDIFDAGRLESGDILITRFTDPGWTPRFGLLAGVATETGGLLSHAAVIAREYGIPAVLAVPGLMQRIQDGQTITLDGDRGEIIVNNEQ
ncbi:MAG TPA: PEP/pyruvate-binding domain-containing protein, partial [Candidatus Obscuribacterales bacterium]